MKINTDYQDRNILQNAERHFEGSWSRWFQFFQGNDTLIKEGKFKALLKLFVDTGDKILENHL
jgi:hypothetical protein